MLFSFQYFRIALIFSVGVFPVYPSLRTREIAPDNELESVQRFTEECNQQNKQKSIYASFTYDPPLNEEPAIDAIGDVFWDDIDDLRTYGSRGLFHAFTVGFGSGAPSGYFGPQATGRGDPDVEQVLFSLWDYKRGGDDSWYPALPVIGEDIQDCSTFDAELNPGFPCCKRNCNDCGQDQSTGTQCKVYIPAQNGMHLRLRIRRIETNQQANYEDTIWTGDIWEVTIHNEDNGHHWLVGRQLLAGTSSSGITRLNNFYEHIGCTHCDAFDAVTRRAGPWILETNSGVATALVSANSEYGNKNPPYTCTKHMIDSSSTPELTFSSGPSVPNYGGDGTWDKELYSCGVDGCLTPDEPKPCSECQGYQGCAGSGGFCKSPQATQGRGRFYCAGKNTNDYGETCARTLYKWIGRRRHLFVLVKRKQKESWHNQLNNSP